MTHALARLAGAASAEVASWLLTYALHSTILLAGAWVLLRFRPLRPAWEEVLWRVAVFGGLATAAAHTFLDVDPLVDAWDVTRLHVAGQGGGAAAAVVPGLEHWLPALALVWACGAALRLSDLGARQRRLLDAMRGRRPARGPARGALREVLAEAPVHVPVRLTQLAGVGTPLALGTREVVVPPDLAVRLSPTSLRGVLAHEVAHLVRRDPLWSLAGAIVEAACFFQPLNRVARRRMAALAEVRADRWAIEWTGSPLAMARGLEQVALAAADDRGLRAGLAATGESRAGLTDRVLRILDPAPEDGRPVGRGPRTLLVGGVLMVMLLALPSFTALHDPPGEHAMRDARPGRPPRVEEKAVLGGGGAAPLRRLRSGPVRPSGTAPHLG